MRTPASRLILITCVLFAPAALADVTPPSISSVAIVGHHPDGTSIVTVGYDFPGMAFPQDRLIRFYIDDGPQVAAANAPDSHGAMTLDLPIFCLAPGGHTLKAVPISCDYFACAPNVPGSPGSTGFSVDTPKITSFSATADASGNAVATVGFDFEWTYFIDDRQIDIYLDGVLVGSKSNIWSLQGTLDIPFSLGCRTPGTYQLEAVALGCKRWVDRKPGSVELPGTSGNVKIHYDQDPNTGGGKITGDWTLPPGFSTGHLTVTQLPVPIAPVGFSDAVNLLDMDVTTPTGTFEINPYAPPSGALQSVRVQARLSACSGQKLAIAVVPCNSCQLPPTATNAPVAFADGNMRYSDSDPLPSHLGSVSLTRTYDTHHALGSLFGRGWWSFLDARLNVHVGTGGDTLFLNNETNDAVVFHRVGSFYSQLWPLGQKARDSLTYESWNGLYVLRRAGATTASLYRASDGRFAGLRRIGTAQEMRVQWSAAGLPESVTDSWTGLTWSIATDAVNRRITSITVGDLVWTYQYDSSGNLTSVSAPANAVWRTYEYGNDLLTASYDAAGHLIESHAYSASGAATDSTGNGDEIASIVYSYNGADKIATLTMKTGAVAQYTLRPVGGMYRTVEIAGGCASCGSREGSFAYDKDGHLVREQNADGYIAVHTYINGRHTAVESALRPLGCDPKTDANRCRLDSVALAGATLQTTTATMLSETAYDDAAWPDKPTKITTPSVSQSGQFRVETLTYHAVTGGVLTRKISGFNGPGVAQERLTTTTLYEGTGMAPAFTPGGPFQTAWLSLPQPVYSVKSIDGPRTDVTDSTSLVYYPVDATVPADWRGRLAATRNAAGHITRFESYDVFGNATRVVDPNGVATESTYDGLGRLLTSTTKAVTGCNTTEDPALRDGPRDHADVLPGRRTTGHVAESRRRSDGHYVRRPRPGVDGFPRALGNGPARATRVHLRPAHRPQGH